MKKFLIVDDQFGIRILLNEVFKRKGTKHFRQRTEFKLLDIVNKHSPDLVFT